jgi:hypothetical protein
MPVCASTGSAHKSRTDRTAARVTNCGSLLDGLGIDGDHRCSLPCDSTAQRASRNSQDPTDVARKGPGSSR